MALGLGLGHLGAIIRCTTETIGKSMKNFEMVPQNYWLSSLKTTCYLNILLGHLILWDFFSFHCLSTLKQLYKLQTTDARQGNLEYRRLSTHCPVKNTIDPLFHYHITHEISCFYKFILALLTAYKGLVLWNLLWSNSVTSDWFPH